MNFKNFTNEEVEYIKKNYSLYTLNEMASHLNKKESSIYNVIHRLGIIKQTHTSWTEEEIQYLKDNFLEKTSEDIAKILNRTVISINAERDRLGLVRNEAWSDEDIKFLQNNFDKMSYGEIGQILNRTQQAVNAKCFDLNLYKKEQPWENWEIEFIKNNYMEMTKSEIAAVLNRSNDAIQVKANRLGLKKSPYHCDYCYFENINTEEKAYWLGFLTADGWVSKNKNTGSGEVGVMLQYGDIEHLRKFNKSISGNYMITDRWRPCLISTKDKNKKYHCCEIRIFSAKMCDDLFNIGLTNEKTYSCAMPNIDENLKRHYVRGFFDGDGTLCYTNKSFSISFTTASEQLCDDLVAIISAQNIHINKRSYVNNFGTTMYSPEIDRKQDKIDFLKWIYDDCEIYLNRKYKKYLKIKEKLETGIKRDGLAV